MPRVNPDSFELNYPRATGPSQRADCCHKALIFKGLGKGEAPQSNRPQEVGMRELRDRAV